MKIRLLKARFRPGIHAADAFVAVQRSYLFRNLAGAALPYDGRACGTAADNADSRSGGCACRLANHFAATGPHPAGPAGVFRGWLRSHSRSTSRARSARSVP